MEWLRRLFVLFVTVLIGFGIAEGALYFSLLDKTLAESLFRWSGWTLASVQALSLLLIGKWAEIKFGKELRHSLRERLHKEAYRRRKIACDRLAFGLLTSIATGICGVLVSHSNEYVSFISISLGIGLFLLSIFCITMSYLDYRVFTDLQSQINSIMLQEERDKEIRDRLSKSSDPQ